MWWHAARRLALPDAASAALPHPCARCGTHLHPSPHAPHTSPLLQAQPGLWLLPDGASHDKDAAGLALELVREKLFRELHRELPYSMDVLLAPPAPRIMADGRLRINMTVEVGSAVQRAIVVGSGGSRISERVVAVAEGELAAALGRRVSLLVTVVAVGRGARRRRGAAAGSQGV